ncbi:hypothetical protein G6F35_015064 [Rhizopus arrhizus]|nr:hypothetical protein G6F35_015064 [Rhizopus arrhizus]
MMRNRRRPPDDAGQLVEEQDEAECGQHLVQMFARIQARQRDAVQQQAQRRHAGNDRGGGQQERAGVAEHGGRDEGAHHVERAVRQVDEIHDAEHQRQAGGQQEQQNAKLQAVQGLHQQQRRGHISSPLADGRDGCLGRPLYFMTHWAAYWSATLDRSGKIGPLFTKATLPSAPASTSARKNPATGKWLG